MGSTGLTRSLSHVFGPWLVIHSSKHSGLYPVFGQVHCHFFGVALLSAYALCRSHEVLMMAPSKALSLLSVIILACVLKCGYPQQHSEHITSTGNWDLSSCQDMDEPTSTHPAMNLRINKVRALCGELCDTSRTGKKGLFFDEISSHVTCSNLFDDIMDASREQLSAPIYLPAEFIDDFSMNGRVLLKRHSLLEGAPLSEPHVFDQVYLGKDAGMNVWTHDNIEMMKHEAAIGTLQGVYGQETTATLFTSVRKANVRGKHVLVIGSETPWVEAICLANGARHVTTLEYGHIESQHPDVTSILPTEFNRLYHGGAAPQFDAVVTFSSVEHSGLGRYGDALNPWGDIITIARAWCVTTDDATLTIGVPWGTQDEIQFNAHRVYSRNRYPYLTSNWRALSFEENDQRIFNFVKVAHNIDTMNDPHEDHVP